MSSIGLTIFHLSRAFFYWRILVYSISIEKWKKSEIPNELIIAELKYLLFYSSIDLFNVKDVKISKEIWHIVI